MEAKTLTVPQDSSEPKKGKRQKATTRLELKDVTADLTMKASAASSSGASKQETGSAALDSTAKDRDRQSIKARLYIAAVVTMTAAVIKVAWMATHAPATPAAAARLPRTLPSTSTSVSNQSAGSEAGNGVEVSRALNRLRDAFHSFPEMDQMELVHEINQKGTDGSMPCPLAWNAGMPSLYVGDKQGTTPPSMTAALNQCATEVEKFRVEKSRLARR